MSILKIVTKKTKVVDTEYLGLYLPKELVTYLTLYSLASGRSKTALVKRQVQKWYDAMIQTNTVDYLISLIVEKSFERWNNPVGKRENFNTFKSLLRIELRNKKLNEYEDKIIELLQNEKNKEE